MAEVKEFRLPDLGEGLEDGEIVRWAVEVGDTIELNQTLAEIETAKAVVEVPSPFAGTVVECNGEVGDTLAVGEVLVRIDVSGGADPARDQAAAADADQTAASEAPASTGLDADEEPQPLVGYGQRGKTGSRRRRKAAGGNGQAAAAEVATVGRPLAKPPVRKLARDLGVDLAALAPGTGPDGVITRADVEQAASTAAPTEAGAPREVVRTLVGRQQAAGETPAPPATEPPMLHAVGGEKPVPGFRGRTPGDVEPIRGIRKRIVEKMEQSRREIPEATCSGTADVTALWDLRETLTEQARNDGFEVKVTPLAIILRAVVLALRRFPTLNGSIDREAGEIRLHEHINLGFAADTDQGLVVPNIKNAHEKSTLQLAAELDRLARAARDGSATPKELTGGTFTVSNYGSFGNDDGNPVINYPEGAILGVGAIRERPWVVDGQVVARRTCTLTLAFDHRISDGGEAGRFLTYMVDLCEQPARILLHV